MVEKTDRDEMESSQGSADPSPSETLPAASYTDERYRESCASHFFRSSYAFIVDFLCWVFSSLASVSHL